MNKITFILNNCQFKILCSKKILDKIPNSKEDLYIQLFSTHMYFIQSKVRNEVFQSFLDDWQNDTMPQLNSDNILDYFQLNQEFGIFDEYFSNDEQLPILYINLLKRSHNIPIDRSNIEKCVSHDLDKYLRDFEDDISHIQFNSLYNIFNHPERVLKDEDNAYQFIIRAANQDQQIFVLLGSLDAKNFKNIENQEESFVKRSEHLGFCPKNTDEIMLQNMKEKQSLLEKNEHLKQVISVFCENVKIYDDEELEKGDYHDKDKYRMFLDEMNVNDLRRLFYILNILNDFPHINILKTHGVFFGNKKMHPCLIQDLCRNDLKKGIKKHEFSNVDKIKIIYQIAEGIKYLYSYHIPCKLTPVDILLDNNKIVKITHFELSYTFPSIAFYSNPRYSVPEDLTDIKSEKYYVYSFGLILFFILTGKDPNVKFEDNGNVVIPDIPSTLNSYSREFIYRTLDINSENTLNFEIILNELTKYHYKLFDLNSSEVNDVGNFIKEHKKAIQ